MNVKQNKGITLIALVITIVVLIIITSISVYYGGGIIKQANLETLKTNMLLIQAKAKEYVEEVNHKLYQNEAEDGEEIYESYGLKKVEGDEISDITGETTGELYYVTNEALDIMGLSQIKEEQDNQFILEFNKDNISVNVFSVPGFQDKHELSELEELEL